MSFALLLALWFGGGAAAIAPAPWPAALLPTAIAPMLSDDAISLPPSQQTLFSPDERYLLRLQAPVNWDSKQVSATLFGLEGDRCQPLWSRLLPHEYGPRYALVSNGGQVVLLDEWINVASPYAILVLGPDGESVAQYSFDQVAATLGVPRADIVDRAGAGWWISAPPRLRRDGQTVEVPTAGDRLLISAATGALSLP